jgi:hypothetical protein
MTPSLSQTCKLPRLEALAPDRITAFFKSQNLDLGTPPVDKGKPLAARWIASQMIANQGG